MPIHCSRGLGYAALFLACSLAGATELPASKRDALDGLYFKGITGEQGKKMDHEDTISFKNGVFRSLDCEGWGFGPAPYSVEKVGDAYEFSATLLSEDRGRLVWKGSIRDGRAEAKFRWLHERWYWDIDRQYWFKGTQAAGP